MPYSDVKRVTSQGLDQMEKWVREEGERRRGRISPPAQMTHPKPIEREGLEFSPRDRILRGMHE